MEKDRIEMSQRDRDVLKVMSLVLKGERTQAEAARLLRLGVRQVRRIQRRLGSQGDQAVVHGLRGKPSNRRIDDAVRRKALALYRRKYLGFGPTLAAEKLAGEDRLKVAVRTLREWLLAQGLWTPKRRRDRHRSRRIRRACFGEMVQADASLHDWLEGRGKGLRLTLVGMIDDATGRMLCRFYPAETSEAYMDLLGRWIGRHGRPLSWYSDRHGIFRAESRLLGEDEPVAAPTQFSRALSELGIELILANSPQAKGRIERLWGTAQDRLVKELRLAGAATLEQANAVLERVFMPWFNRRCTVQAAGANDAHRQSGKAQDLAAILCPQETRGVANDYTIRLDNRTYQLLPPAWPGERGGQVVVEKRLDGSMKVRFKRRYLEYRKIEVEGLAAPGGEPLSLTPGPIPAVPKAKGPASVKAGSSAVHRTAGRSGRTPALPYPPGGKSCGTSTQAWRPAPNHPWRKTG
jgi:Helix-turn-helix domain